MKKQLLLIVMLLAAANAFAVEVKIDGLWYELVKKTKEAKVIQYKNDAKYKGDIVVPETVMYEGVTCSVTNIGQVAFYYCSGLTSISIPSSVTSIGFNAFLGCTGLKKVIVKDIAAWSGIDFDGSFSNPLVYGEHLYADEKTEITDLIIPNSVTSIGEWAFSSCIGLTSVSIPNSVTSIGQGAFCGCSGLTSVSIPNSVTSIGVNAFYGCSGLTSVVIGSGVKNISSEAFASCPELTDVTCYAENVPSTVRNAFDGSDIQYATLHVPTASIDAYKTTYPWSRFKNFKGLDGMTDGIVNVPAKAVLIRSAGGIVQIEGIEDGAPITLYTPDGKQAGSAVSRNGAALVRTSIKPGNVAIVKFADKSVKVVVK